MKLALLVLGLIAALSLLLRWLFRRVIREYAGPRWLLFLGIVLFVGGTLLVINQSRAVERHEYVRLWPTTDGVVISSEVAGERAFHPEVVYEYQVLGQTYQGLSTLQVPGFGGKRKRDEVATKEIANYWPGRTVTVYYNPDDPSESLLHTRLEWAVYGQLGFGGTLVLAGLLLILWPRRQTG